MRADVKPADRMRSVLRGHIDHEGVQALLEAGNACDEAQAYLLDGDYHLALQTALPLVLLQTPVLKERAREIAISALDELIEQAIAQGEPERALDYLNQWLSLEPNAFFPLLRRAEVLHYGLQNYDQAWNTYLQVLRHYPNSIEAMIGLAQLSLIEGNPERAYPYILRAWQTLSTSEWGYTPGGRTFLSVFEDLYDITAGLLQWLGSNEEAREVTEKAMSLLGESELLRERLRMTHDSDEE